MATLPNYLHDQTEETIRQRMLDSLPSDLDKAEGSFLWDALAPASIELAQAAIWAQEVLRRGFASTTFGTYLDLRCEEHGLTRRPAVKATGQVKLTGKAGATVPAGTRVATPADRVTGTSSVEFVTKAPVTLDGSGSGTVDIEAVEAGMAGNVLAGAISLMMIPAAGVISMSNAAATVGGIDTESDESLRSRYLQKVRNPSAGGNKADYVNWALEVAGVGGVSVVPVRDGPGSVSVAIINSNSEPTSQSLIDAVQAYIAPPWSNTMEAETLTIGGYGVSIDTSQPDDTGSSMKMVYSTSGAGTLTGSLHPILQQPGIWQARVRLRVDSTASTSNLLQIGVWNVTLGAWAKTTPFALTNAVQTFRAADLSDSYELTSQDFYWNGSDQLELRITRQQTDTTTTVWVDQCMLVSTFSTATGDGNAPVGARVTVESASPVLINISATLTIPAGYNVAGVRAAATSNVAQYIKSLAFADDNDVRHVRIGQAILDTIGIQDYSDLLVNGGTGNVSVGIQEVAVLGVVTFT